MLHTSITTDTKSHVHISNQTEVQVIKLISLIYFPVFAFQVFYSYLHFFDLPLFFPQVSY